MNSQYFLIFIPMICVYISGYYFPVKDYDDKKINFKPPSYVFGIVWPILLTLIGISYYMSTIIFIMNFDIFIINMDVIIHLKKLFLLIQAKYYLLCF